MKTNHDALVAIDDAALDNVAGGDSLITLIDLSGVLSGLGVLGSGGNNPTNTNTKPPGILGLGGVLGIF